MAASIANFINERIYLTCPLTANRSSDRPNLNRREYIGDIPIHIEPPP